MPFLPQYGAASADGANLLLRGFSILFVVCRMRCTLVSSLASQWTGNTDWEPRLALLRALLSRDVRSTIVQRKKVPRFTKVPKQRGALRFRQGDC